jgi:hypothetical protein
VIGNDARPGHPAHALHFVALDCEHDLVAPGIAGHDPQIGAEQVVEHRREVAARSALVGGAHDQLLPKRVREGFRRGVGAGNANEGFDIGIAQIDEFARVVLGRNIADQGLEDGAGIDRPGSGPVLRRHRIDECRELVAPGAGHVLRQHGRISRNMAAEAAGKQARIGIVAAARGTADVEIDLLAAIELSDPVLRLRRNGKT